MEILPLLQETGWLSAAVKLDENGIFMMAIPIGETEKYPTGDNNHEKRKHFLICESCLWCASSLSTPGKLFKIETTTKCPLCNNDRVMIIPLFLGGL